MVQTGTWDVVWIGHFPYTNTLPHLPHFPLPSTNLIPIRLSFHAPHLLLPTLQCSDQASESYYSILVTVSLHYS